MYVDIEREEYIILCTTVIVVVYIRIIPSLVALLEMKIRRKEKHHVGKE